MDNRLRVGRLFFGVATLASGVLQLAIGGMVRLVPKLPAWVPAPSIWPYAVGVVLIAVGLAIVAGRMVRTAATVLAAMILADVVLLYAPLMVVNPVVDRPFFRGFMWTNPLKCLALIGGAAILAARHPDEPRVFTARGVARLLPLAAVFLAVFLVVCGVQHFWYRDFVTAMVPAFMPARRFWTYFTGTALICGGTGILVPRTARLAATLSAVMIFLWVLMLHIPRALAGPAHANETAGIFEALALSGVALLVSACRPDRPRSG
jgi:uncharacterized membrane protein YphA (DoxX/SURF4 family)